MTYAGARGNTAKEMAQTLHFTLDNDRLHPAFGELIRKVRGADKKRNYDLAVANSLWGAKGLSLDPKFVRITQTDYQAGFQLVDFANDPEGARQRINGWVGDQTKKRITELLKKGIVGAYTRLLLVNAVYFKGDWSVPFPKAATKQQDFTVPGRPAFKAPMMNHVFVTGYMENAEFQLTELMYKDNELSMVVILPKKADGLADLEKNLSAKSIAHALSLTRARTGPRNPTQIQDHRRVPPGNRTPEPRDERCLPFRSRGLHCHAAQQHLPTVAFHLRGGPKSLRGCPRRRNRSRRRHRCRSHREGSPYSVSRGPSVLVPVTAQFARNHTLHRASDRSTKLTDCRFWPHMPTAWLLANRRNKKNKDGPLTRLGCRLR